MLTAFAASPATASAAEAPKPDAAVAAQGSPATTTADAFYDALRKHCGKAYGGKIVANEPPSPNDAFAGKTLVMHVRRCSDEVLEIPFHVGEDHSRTWVIRRTAAGFDLEHDHRHADGSPDKVTLYGGETTSPGTATRQEFPADAYSRELFEREGLVVSVTNTWALEIHDSTYVYELARPGRLFRVEFDLTAPVALPPTPWGHD